MSKKRDKRTSGDSILTRTKKLFEEKYADFNIEPTTLLTSTFPEITKQIDGVEFMNIEMLAIAFTYLYTNLEYQPVFTQSMTGIEINQYAKKIMKTPINIDKLNNIISNVYLKSTKEKADEGKKKSGFNLWGTNKIVSNKITIEVAIYGHKILIALAGLV